jgi:hypothetical protein
LIVTARKLARSSPRRPRQAELKRAVSTAYYALFQAIAKDAADMLVGVGPNRPGEAWTHIYRSLQHGDAKTACAAVRNLAFPAVLADCAEAFVALQEDRHDADYNPDLRVLRAEAVAAIDRAERAIEDLRAAARRDRKAFAVHLLHKRRR